MNRKRRLVAMSLCAVGVVFAGLNAGPARAQDAPAREQSQRVMTEMTANWGDDARLTLAELSALPTRSDGPDVQLPDMEVYRDALSKLQNLRTHTEIAINRLRNAPQAASIGPRSAKDIARSLEKVKESLSQPIIDLYEAERAEAADRAVQSAIATLVVGMQSVPQL